MIELENRLTPNGIPGWDGPTELVIGQLDGTPYTDTIQVALLGGSARVYIQNHLGETLLDTIAFDPSFRGGGHVAMVGHSLLVVPGVSGGPIVDQFDFNTTTNHIELTTSYFAPYDQAFRGGLHVSSALINGKDEALFLPGEGGAPHLIAVDLRTHETDYSIFVGNSDDVSGLSQFEPTGGTVSTSSGNAFIVQYGISVNDHVPTTLWLLTGVQTEL